MNNLEQVKYNNDLILTTNQLAEFYGTTEDRIKKNFNYNIDKFIEGKHFYKLVGQDLKSFKDSVLNSDLVGKKRKRLNALDKTWGKSSFKNARYRSSLEHV